MRKTSQRALDQRPARTLAARRRSVRRALQLAVLSLAAFVTLLITPSGYARLIFDVTDPAFNTATLEPFAPGDAPQGATSFTITRNGVEFTFSTSNPQGLFFCSGGDCTLRAPYPQGIDVQISPPVAAIGFRHSWVECPGSVTFDGTLGSETFAPPNFSGPRNFFVGASGWPGRKLQRQCESFRPARPEPQCSG